MQQPWNPWSGWYNTNAIFYVIFFCLLFTAPIWMIGLWKIYAAWQRHNLLQERKKEQEEKKQRRKDRKSRKRRRR